MWRLSPNDFSPTLLKTESGADRQNLCPSSNAVTQCLKMGGIVRAGGSLQRAGETSPPLTAQTTQTTPNANAYA